MKSDQQPALQNIPIRTELGVKLRQAFLKVNSKLWHSVWNADYSSLEARTSLDFIENLKKTGKF